MTQSILLIHYVGLSKITQSYLILVEHAFLGILNVTIEMDKAIPINVIATAIENLSMNIVEAAESAGQVCGHSGQTVHRWAFSFFTSISAYSCLEDVHDDFISAELSSERGTSSVKDRIIHNEDFKLAA